MGASCHTQPAPMIDLRTVFIVTALTSVFMGLLQVAAFSRRQSDPWLLGWGISALMLGIGLSLTSMQGYLDDVWTVQLGNAISLCAYFIQVVSVRSFCARTLHLGMRTGLILMITGLVIVLCLGSFEFSNRIVFLSLLCALCDAIIVREAWRLAQRERIPSMYLVICLFGISAAGFITRAALAWTGHFGTNLFDESISRHWLSILGAPLLLSRGIALLLVAYEREHVRLQEQAYSDGLTGMRNRQGLRVDIDAMLGPQQEHRSRYAAVIAIDIDHFKAVNDAFGHPAGDVVLQLVGRAIQDSVAVPIVAGRIGGDEFLVVLPQISRSDAAGIAERIRMRFLVLSAAHHPDMRPTISLGLSHGPISTAGLRDLIARADTALYASKTNGRNRIGEYDDSSVSAGLH